MSYPAASTDEERLVVLSLFSRHLELPGELLKLASEIVEAQTTMVPPEQRRLKQLTQTNDREALRDLLSEHDFPEHAFFAVHEQDVVETAVLHDYITPSINMRGDFERATLEVFFEAEVLDHDTMFLHFVSMMKAQFALGQLDQRMEIEGENEALEAIMESMADDTSPPRAHGAYARGIPGPEDTNEESVECQARMDHYAAILDLALDYTDDPHTILRNNGRLGHGLENQPFLAQMATNPDVAGFIDRCDDLLVDTALWTTHPTPNLKQLVDNFVSSGYEISDEQQERYDRVYQSPE